MTNHTGPRRRSVVAGLVSRTRPCPTAKLVALVVAKERTDTTGPQICGSVLLRTGHNDRIRQDNTVVVDSALDVTEKDLTATRVIGEVRKRLHNTSPRDAIICPSSVRVELLIVRNERFLQNFSAGKFKAAVRVKGPYFWEIHFDYAVNEVVGIPLGNETNSFL